MLKIYNTPLWSKLRLPLLSTIIKHDCSNRVLLLLNFVISYINKKIMKFKVTNNENVSTVFLNGEIDMDIADDVREIVFPLIDSGKEVHLNLKDVQYMDSSGISVIIESNQRAREKNTKVELKEVSQPVEKVLAMARKFLWHIKLQNKIISVPYF